MNRKAASSVDANPQSASLRRCPEAALNYSNLLQEVLCEP